MFWIGGQRPIFRTVFHGRNRRAQMPKCRDHLTLTGKIHRRPDLGADTFGEIVLTTAHPIKQSVKHGQAHLWQGRAPPLIKRPTRRCNTFVHIRPVGQHKLAGDGLGCGIHKGHVAT